MFNEGTPPVPVTNISPEDIQKCLEENEQLILAIMENQNLGRYNECAPHRAQLQQNLTFLSSLADALQHRPPPLVPPQMLAESTMQQLQHPQSQQQAAASFPRPPPPPLHPQQFIQAQMSMQIGALTANNQAYLGEQQAASSPRLHPSFLHPQQFIQPQIAMQIGVGMENNQEGLGARGASNFLGNSVFETGGAASFLGKSVSRYNNGGE